MNPIDSLIGFFSPRRGLERTRARVAAKAVKRAYEGASAGKRGSHWRAPTTSANAEIGASAAMLRGRARDLVRNNPYATRAADVLAGHIVGAGIVPRSRTGSDRLDKQVDALWSKFAKTADADGVLDVYGLQLLAVRTMVESGESFLRFRKRRPSDGLPVPLQIELLEPDFLDASKDGETVQGGGKTVQGIELDALNRRVAYHMFRGHPGEAGLTGAETARVPAGEVAHLYRKLRPGQQRGASWFAPVVVKLRDLDEYHEAALVKAKVEACFAGFVSRPEAGTIDPLGPATEDDNGDRIESLEPGMLNYLRPGEEVTFASPTASGAFEPYTLQTLMSVAVGLGITLDQLTGDLRHANYSSLRAGKIEFRRLLEQHQWLTVVPMICEPMWAQFINAAVLAGLLPDRAEGYPVEWAPPRNERIDPKKDLEADIMEVRAGSMTLSQLIAANGYDPKRQLAEIAETNKLIDKHGLVLTTDPRVTADSGALQITSTPKTEGDATSEDP